MLLPEVKRPRRLQTVQPPEQRKCHRVLNQIKGAAAAAKRLREQRQRIQVVAKAVAADGAQRQQR